MTGLDVPALPSLAAGGEMNDEMSPVYYSVADRPIEQVSCTHFTATVVACTVHFSKLDDTHVYVHGYHVHDMNLEYSEKTMP